jgi:peptidoglycan/LPS O-acetylase OafA/YrhL
MIGGVSHDRMRGCSPMTPIDGSSKRERHLDGLRGIAAFIVVLQHVGGILPASFIKTGPGLLTYIEATILTLPFRAGVFAVYVFFAISGVVIANAADGNKPWPRSLVSRYLRLTLPMLVASLFAWVMLGLFPHQLAAIGVFLPNHLTVDDYQHGNAPLSEALWEPIWCVYQTGNPYLNPVLWSMRVELWGSLAILTFYRLAPEKTRIPAAFLAAILLVFFACWKYVPFALAPVIYEINRRKPIRGRFGSGAAIVVLGVAIAIAGELATAHVTGKALSDVAITHGNARIFAYGIGALIVVFGVMASRHSSDMLLLKIPQFLGRISYGLYLVHMPLLYTAFAALYLRLGAPPRWSWLIPWGALYLATSIVAGYLMTALVDEPWSLVRRRFEGASRRETALAR